MIEPAGGPLEGQVALVTGAGQGVGRQVALDLGAQGVAVALAALSVEDLDEVAAEVEASGGQALVVPSEVTDPVSVQSMVSRVEGSLGPVDLLVTAAERPGAAVEFLNGDPEQWWRVVEGALRGPALCAYYVLKRMVPRRRGRIVNILGDWSLGPAPVLSELACSEAAVLRLTDSLALASWSYGVSVFAVSAGRVAIEAGPDPEEEAVTRGPAGLQEAARLVSELATGSADRLTGRFFRVGDDLQELVRRSDQVEAEDCLQLRLLPLQAAPPEEVPAAVAFLAAPAEDESPTGLSKGQVLPPPSGGMLVGGQPETGESAASDEAEQPRAEEGATSTEAPEAPAPAEPEAAESAAAAAESAAPTEPGDLEEPPAGDQPKDAAAKGAADGDSHEAAPPDRVEQ